MNKQELKERVLNLPNADNKWMVVSLGDVIRLIDQLEESKILKDTISKSHLEGSCERPTGLMSEEVMD